MGLDMFMKAKVYVGGRYHNVKGLILADKNIKRLDKEPNYMPNYMELPVDNISSVVYDIGYWRKANYIHKWFVDNVQGGEDDCKEYPVSIDMLNNLGGICQKLLAKKDKEKAKELLPSCDGFFFGGNENDENYWEYFWEDLRYTLEVIKLASEYISKYNAGIFYSSSW